VDFDGSGLRDVGLLVGGGVAFFVVVGFFDDGKVAFGSCADLARLAGKYAGMKGIAIAQRTTAKINWVRN
jgi:hypothetical protein